MIWVTIYVAVVVEYEVVVMTTVVYCGSGLLPGCVDIFSGVVLTNTVDMK